jgi:hypothetical protein
MLLYFSNEIFFKEEKMKTREDKRKKILKKSAHSLLMHGHSSWSTFDSYLMRGPKTLSIDLKINRTMDIGPSSQTIEKGHLPWSHFMVHGVNWP